MGETSNESPAREAPASHHPALDHIDLARVMLEIDGVATDQPSSFFQLPVEIRLKIYSLVLSGSEIKVELRDEQAIPVLPKQPILFTSRRCYTESLPLLLSEATWRFDNPGGDSVLLEQFLDDPRNQKYVSSIRRIHCFSASTPYHPRLRQLPFLETVTFRAPIFVDVLDADPHAQNLLDNPYVWQSFSEGVFESVMKQLVRKYSSDFHRSINLRRSQDQCKPLGDFLERGRRYHVLLTVYCTWAVANWKTLVQRYLLNLDTRAVTFQRGVRD